MKYSIFIKSYPKDFEWLAYCLKSIQKYVTGFDEIVVQVPPGSHLQLTAERVIQIPETEPGYLYQQVAKQNADLRCRGDYILHVDSDCVFTRPVSPETFMVGDKPRWLILPLSHWALEEKRAWLHVMTKFMLECPEYEFMRKCTIMLPRWFYAKFREFVQSFHGITMEAYTMNQSRHAYSEYNCMGFYAYKFHRDAFVWHNTVTDGLPEPWEMQSWSYGGITPEIRARLEEITK